MNISLSDKSLKNYNFYAFLLHFISGVVISIVFFTIVGEINFNTDLFSYKITKIGEGSGNRNVEFSFGKEGDPMIEIKDIFLKIIVVSIFLITSFFHLFYYKSNKYITEINKGYNRFRWIEYSITSTLMIFILCIISGVKEYYTVFSICALNILLMSMGYFLELSSLKEVKIVALVVGFFALTSIFSIIYANMIYNLKRAEDLDFDIPEWVKFVVFPMILWWISFGVVAILNTKNYGKPGYNYKRYEKYYIILSFLSKAFMGYYLTFGLTRKESSK